MSLLLECSRTKKSYGNKVALDDISLKVESGRIIGLLGPNGCGKTTLMKMIAGLLWDKENSISVDGSPVGEKTKMIISYAPDRICFEKGEKLGEIVNFYDYMFDDFDKETARENLEKMNINLDDRIGALSKGTAEKFQIILMMSRKARLYLFDEPFGGVDPAVVDSIIKIMLTLMPEDASMIISTHQIMEIENILDEAIFMKNGRILFHKSAEDIRKERGMSLNEVFKEEFR